MWLAYNAVQFGNPLDSGFLRDTVPGFGSPILTGVTGFLFSPSTSIFLYSPPVVLGVLGLGLLARRDKRAAWLLSALCALFLCFCGTLGNWIGDRSYGSRYLLVVLPCLAIGWMFWRRPPVVTARAADDDRGFSQQFAFSLDMWWLYLFYLGALPPRPIVWSIVTAIVVFAAVMGHRLARLLSEAGLRDPASPRNASA